MHTGVYVHAFMVLHPGKMATVMATSSVFSKHVLLTVGRQRFKCAVLNILNAMRTSRVFAECILEHTSRSKSYFFGSPTERNRPLFFIL